MMLELGDPLTEEEIEEFFAAVDIDNDGQMSYEEFVGAWQKNDPVPRPADITGCFAHGHCWPWSDSSLNVPPQPQARQWRMVGSAAAMHPG